MTDQKVFTVAKDSMQPLQYRCLYNIGGMRFVLPEPLKKGKMVMASIAANKRTAADQSALLMKISSGGETKEVEVLGRRDVIKPSYFGRGRWTYLPPELWLGTYPPYPSR